jgi:phenylpropionate dioxygenase-like ring-hydroxylating dioxygenase large terminal subunit
MSVFDELAAHAGLEFSHGRMLPLEAYRSDTVLAAEREAIFAGAWTCVGRSADLASPGDHLTAEVPSGAGGTAEGHRSIIVVRGDDGELMAHDNVCIHRGARLLEGCGNIARITCPYHAWAFRLDGSLIGAPHLSEPGSETTALRPGEHRLGRIRLEEWEGFVFVSLDPGAPALAPRLTGLRDVLAPYRLAGYVPVHQQVDVWRTNWKLLVENFMDAYHVFKVHKATFGAKGDHTLDTQMCPGTDDWAHHVVVEDGGDDLAHPDNTSLVGDRRRTIVLAAVFPTHVMQVQPDWLWYLQISPLGTDRVRIRWDVSVAPEVLAGAADPAAHVAGLLTLLHAVNAEDRPVTEAVRRNADGPQFARGPLSYLERNVFDFDRFVARRLARFATNAPPAVERGPSRAEHLGVDADLAQDQSMPSRNAASSPGGIAT